MKKILLLIVTLFMASFYGVMFDLARMDDHAACAEAEG